MQSWAVIFHSEMKGGYGNVPDEPGETWPRLATFTQNWINLFSHPALPLCIPDEAERGKLCLRGVVCHLQSPKYMLRRCQKLRKGTHQLCFGHMPRPELTTESCTSDRFWDFSFYLVRLISSGSSLHTGFYLKVALCMVAVPNKELPKAIHLSDLWSEISP